MLNRSDHRSESTVTSVQTPEDAGVQVARATEDARIVAPEIIPTPLADGLPTLSFDPVEAEATLAARRYNKRGRRYLRDAEKAESEE